MWYRSVFNEFEKKLNGESSSPVHALRRDAIAEFDGTGFPTRKHEEWKYTDVAKLAKTPYVLAVPVHDLKISTEQIAAYSFGSKNRLVFINGFFAPSLSNVALLPKGLAVGSLSNALNAKDALAKKYCGSLATPSEGPFVALNTAFLRDGAFIVVDEGVHVKEVVSLIFLAAGADTSLIVPRNLVVVGKNSRLSIVETYVAFGAEAYFTDAVTEIIVGEDAVVEHDKLQDEHASASHIASIYVRQGSHSIVTSNAISVGGSLVRNNVTAVFAGEHAECTLNGLSLATGTQLIDNHTTIDHAKPNCASHELYKSILDGKSRGVFNGKIFVRKDAQKTDAKQTNKTLLLSDDATVDTKPQLEIFADDVKCTHGATVGQLDEDQVFYLRARGIGETEARDILTLAFAKDVANRIHVDAVREQVERLVFEKLHQGRSEL